MPTDTPTPVEMTGLSMAPILLPGDLLLIEPVSDPQRLRLGDVVVFRDSKEDQAVVHRVIKRSEGPLPFLTKGDRNSKRDPLSADWEFQGIVRRRCRDGKWKSLGWRRLFWLLSVAGLYPGQKIPSWLNRSGLRKAFRVGKR